jgi:hypothetical protein
MVFDVTYYPFYSYCITVTWKEYKGANLSCAIGGEQIGYSDGNWQFCPFFSLLF